MLMLCKECLNSNLGQTNQDKADIKKIENKTWNITKDRTRQKNYKVISRENLMPVIIFEKQFIKIDIRNK